jgi:Family of unknown function (DUF6325)
VEVIELQDIEDEDLMPYVAVAGDLQGLLTKEDVETVADSVPEGSAAAVALIEHRWAVGLQESVEAAGGCLLATERIPKSVVDELNRELVVAVVGSVAAGKEDAGRVSNVGRRP